MEAKAVSKYVRMSPRKVRQVMNLVRGKNVDEALTILKFTPKAASEVIGKTINRDELYVAAAYVDPGPTLKRLLPRMRGMADRILKRTCHVTVIVREREG